MKTSQNSVPFFYLLGAVLPMCHKSSDEGSEFAL